MDRAVCPYCYQALPLHEGLQGVTVKCPCCRQFFDTDTPLPSFFSESRRTAPIEVKEDGSPDRHATLLTGPYACSRCAREINTPTGLRRSTILCPSCHCKTSLYAIIYWCPTSKHLLESPICDAGRQTACPACQKPCEVPQDVLLRRRVPERESRWFAFHCPGCHAHLETAHQYAGRLAVCPECLHSLEVPYSGEALEPVMADGAARPARSQTLRSCPSCRLRIPAHARQCPYCRTSKARPRVTGWL
jgi:hypothetical protein